jgi:hypothetical protein
MNTINPVDAARIELLLADLRLPAINFQVNGKAERLGGLEVYDQLELSRLYDRQVGGLGALEDATRVYTLLAIPVGKIGAVTNQATGGREFTPAVDRKGPFPPGDRAVGIIAGASAERRDACPSREHQQCQRRVRSWN